jgi:hypothetical protein
LSLLPRTTLHSDSEQLDSFRHIHAGHMYIQIPTGHQILFSFMWHIKQWLYHLL